MGDMCGDKWRRSLKESVMGESSIEPKSHRGKQSRLALDLGLGELSPQPAATDTKRSSSFGTLVSGFEGMIMKGIHVVMFQI